MEGNAGSSTLCCDKCGLWLDGLGNDHEAREHIDRLTADLGRARAYARRLEDSIVDLEADRDRYRAALERISRCDDHGIPRIMATEALNRGDDE